MKYLKSFNESSKFLTNPSEIKLFLDQVCDEDYSYRINEDGSIDVEGDVGIGGVYCRRWFTSIPVKFRKVNGIFTIYSSMQLTSLEGSPEECVDFNVLSNPIKNLKGGPKIVTRDYDVQGSTITSLEGTPEIIPGCFDIMGTPVTSLVGGPKKVGGYFECSETAITSFIGAPIETGDFYAKGIDIESFEGFPKKCGDIAIETKFSTLWNPKGLRDLECDSLDVDENEPIWNLIKLFDTLDLRTSGDIFSRFKESLDYNYIRGNVRKPQINLFRLKEAFSESGIVKPIDLKDDGQMWNYTFVDDDGRPVNFWGDPI